MKAYWGMDVEIHIFLTSALVGGEWLALRPGRFNPQDRRLGVSQIFSGRRGEENILDTAGN
jgi:hypothetical protein